MAETDPFVRTLKFTPDYLVVDQSGNRAWAEVKCSPHVERDAFLVYESLNQSQPVFLVLDIAGTGLLRIKLKDVVWRQSDWVKGDSNRGSGNYYRTVDLLKTPYLQLLPPTVPVDKRVSNN